MGRLVFRWVVFLASLLCPLVSVRADSSPPPVPAESHSVLESPRRIPGQTVDVSAYPGNATVITAEDIRRWGASTIQEALSHAEGVQVFDQQGFGLGSDGTVNLRGVVNSSRTNALVLVDGVRQNRLTGDEVHWQSIPPEQVERVEIIRGGGGMIYGEGALAGVINITTKQDAPEPLRTETTTELGSFGWQQYGVQTRGTTRPFHYAVNSTRRMLDGYRDFSKSRETAVTTHVGFDAAPTLSANLHVLHSDDTTGFPGLITLAQSQQRQQQTNAFHGLNHNEIDQVALDIVGGPWNGWSTDATLYWHRWIQHSEDSIVFNAFTITPSRGLSLRSSHEWLGHSIRNLLVSGMELADEQATTGDPGAGPDSESNRSGYGTYLEDTVTIAERLTIVGGLRYDRSRYEESLVFPAFEGTLRFQGWSPKIGVTYALVPHQCDLFASYARPFKGPNVDDFSSRLGSSFSGNADLKPQQADTYETGARLSQGPLQASATLFYIRTNEEIMFNQLASPLPTNQNFDTRRMGVELSTRAETKRLRLSAAYTFVDAEFSEGQFVDSTIPGTPKHWVHAGIGVSPLDRLWIDLDWKLVQDSFRFNDIGNRLGGADNYGVLNLLCSYELPRPAAAKRWLPDARAYAKILNITGEEYVEFQSSNGLNLTGAGEAPMPPTQFIGGLTLSW